MHEIVLIETGKPMNVMSMYDADIGYVFFNQETKLNPKDYCESRAAELRSMGRVGKVRRINQTYQVITNAVTDFKQGIKDRRKAYKSVFLTDNFPWQSKILEVLKKSNQSMNAKKIAEILQETDENIDNNYRIKNRIRGSLGHIVNKGLAVRVKRGVYKAI